MRFRSPSNRNTFWTLAIFGSSHYISEANSFIGATLVLEICAGALGVTRTISETVKQVCLALGSRGTN